MTVRARLDRKRATSAASPPGRTEVRRRRAGRALLAVGLPATSSAVGCQHAGLVGANGSFDNWRAHFLMKASLCCYLKHYQAANHPTPCHSIPPTHPPELASWCQLAPTATMRP